MSVTTHATRQLKMRFWTPITVLIHLAAASALPLNAQSPAPSPANTWAISTPEAVFDPGQPIYTLTATKEASVWMAALEESAFMRSRLGDWLPCAVYRTAPGQALRWQVQKAYRKDNECYLTMVFEGADGKKNAFTTSWYDKGENVGLDPDIKNDEPDGNAFLTFTQSDGNTRRVWVRRSRNLEELSREVKVSKAKPLWTWSEENLNPL